jgi:hypothetical protein
VDEVKNQYLTPRDNGDTGGMGDFGLLLTARHVAETKELSMKSLLLAAPLLLIASVAYAGIPMLNATCPGKIEVHADEGGPIYINGKEAKLKKFNDNYFEAKGAGVTISLSINPDGSPGVSYTGKNKANGICEVKQG